MVPSHHTHLEDLRVVYLCDAVTTTETRRLLTPLEGKTVKYVQKVSVKCTVVRYLEALECALYCSSVGIIPLSISHQRRCRETAFRQGEPNIVHSSYCTSMCMRTHILYM